MARTRHRFVCGECEVTHAKWLGRCPECGAWGSLEESATREGAASEAVPPSLVRLDQMAHEVGTGERRLSGMGELDSVLGGGVVPGGAVLLAGEPGIGKSTLLLQLAAALARGDPDGDTGVVYVCAEESPQQIQMRAARLGVEAKIQLAETTELESVTALLESAPPDLLLVDSVQALRGAGVGAPPGATSQVRHCSESLVSAAKRSGRALFLVGHVTKEGAIAGPKALEHLVDTVLSFEGERDTQFRILRAVKNRFGSTGEVALYEMREDGLTAVKDPSRVLLTRQHGTAPGSVVTPTISGSRALLVEIQALVHASSIPTPRRMSIGIDGNRVALLVAVLERFAGAKLREHDLYLNVIGGLSLSEPAADLAIAAAILSARHGRALPREAVFFGEVGLLGEVRPVARTPDRLRAAAARGFRQAYLATEEAPPKGVKIQTVAVPRIENLAERFLARTP